MRRLIVTLCCAVAMAVLPGCKKDSDGAKKLIDTQWEAAVNNSTENASERILYFLSFEKKSKCTLHQIREVRTKMSDPDEQSEYTLSGTFTLKENALTVVFKTAEGDFPGTLPMTCKGSSSDDNLMLTLEIEGRTCAFTPSLRI